MLRSREFWVSAALLIGFSLVACFVVTHLPCGGSGYYAGC